MAISGKRVVDGDVADGVGEPLQVCLPSVERSGIPGVRTTHSGDETVGHALEPVLPPVDVWVEGHRLHPRL